MPLNQLPENHYFISKQCDIRSICKPILSKHGITYFNYLRVENDRRCYIYSTHNEIIKYMFHNNIPLAAPVDPKLVSNKFCYMILPTGPYSKAIHDAKSDFDLANFIDLVELHENYLELFCFGSSGNNDQIINFYLNNMDFLENFKPYFREKAEKLLDDGADNYIQVAAEMMPPYEINILNNQDFCINGNNIHFSKREIECIKFQMRGKTMKDIALILGISPRTVEHYIERIKQKLNVKTKSELIEIIYEHGIINK